MDLLIGTQNPGKLREYREMLADVPVRLLGLGDVGLGKMQVDEPAETFEENAELKAVAYARAAGMFALADDSGLVVDALDGRPGVYSARYAGENATDADRRAKLLGELAGVENRSARFVCVTVIFNPQTHSPYVTKGVCAGQITQKESDGPYGFGYDPIFMPEGHTVTMADLEPAVKHDLSHRGRAFRQMIPIIERLSRE